MILLVCFNVYLTCFGHYFKVVIKCLSASNEQYFRFKNQTNSDGVTFINLESGYHKISVFDGDLKLLDSSFLVYSDTIFLYSIKNYLELSGFKLISNQPVVNLNQDRSTFSQSTLKSISLPMSTNDPMQLLKLLPGVSNSQEMNCNVNIRGADAYSTVYYLDNIPVPNLTHSFGLFSFFDLNTIRMAEVLNNQISAEFGSRGSSFVKFYLMDPLLNKNTSEIQINPFFISSNLNLKLKKEKMGVFFNVRKSILSNSYSEVLPLFSNFHDILFKFKYNINKQASLKCVFQNSRDNASRNYGFGLNIPDSSAWQFTLGSIEYSEINKKGMNSELSGFFKTQKNSQKLFSENLVLNQLDEINLKYRIQQKFNSVSSKLGLETQLHSCNIITDSNNYSTTLGIHSMFADHSIEIQKVRMFLNLRASYFSQIQRYYLEKRLGVNYKFKTFNVFVEMNDFINNYHVLSNNIFPVATDYRFLPNSHFLPLRTNEKLFGLSHKNKSFTIQTTLFYRNYFNSLDYKLLSASNQNSISNIVKVEHKSYGIESACNINISKKYLISLNYTYSKSILRSDSINLGNSYVSNYDRPHIFNLLNSYKYKRFVFSTIFTFQSGRRTSIPIYKAFANRPVYSERNELKLKDFHQLNIGVQYQFREKSRYKQFLSFNVYNIYSRKNVYGVVIKKDNSNVNQYYYLTAFPILPSFSYTIKF